MTYTYKTVYHQHVNQWDVHVYYNTDHWWSAGRFDSQQNADNWIAAHQKQQRPKKP